VMAAQSLSERIDSLLSQVVYNRGYNALDGLNPIRVLLRNDAGHAAESILKANLTGLPDTVRGGIAFALGEKALAQGDLTAIRALFELPDAEIQRSVMNALWGEPYAGEALGDEIVALAVAGTLHDDPGIRAEAASVLQNQAAWGVSVAAAIEPLAVLLTDVAPRVLLQAAYAVGNVARPARTAQRKQAVAAGNAAPEKYDLTAHIAPLTINLRHEDVYVRKASAWALWQLSKQRYDISDAVANLTHVLASADDYSEPRKMAAGALLHYAGKNDENRDALPPSRPTLAAKRLPDSCWS